MKLFTGGVMSAGLVLAGTSANAQMLAPYQIGGPRYSAVSDFDGPYAEMPPEVPAPRYGPRLLPAPEVYTVVRENGFSPLGIPRQRGFVYTISVINRDGDDGQLVIDARNGRIIRFMPAYRMGGNIDRNLGMTYGVSPVRGVPRPPAPIPRLASRTPSVPLPRAMPPHAGDPKPLAATPAPAPAEQSAAIQPKPPEAAPAPSTVGAAAAAAKPATPQIRPTQEMPKMQDLE
ncbi:MAG: hypothetical protein ABI407_17815 [Bradyrhizobium sp.]